MAPTPGTELSLDERLSGLQTVMRWHPDETKRIAAGRLAVGIYVRCGRYSDLARLTVDDASLPEGLQQFAEEKLPAAARKALQRKDAGELETLAVDATLPHDIRIAAGEKLRELYVQHAGDIGGYNLLELAQNKHVPDEVRISAGKNLVEVDVKKGDYIELLTLYHNRKVPDEVRSAAEAGMEAALPVYIKEWVEDGEYEQLHEELTKNRRIPAPHRMQIRAALDPAAEKAIEDYAKDSNYLALKEIADERFLPKEVRKKARDIATSAAPEWIRQNENLRYRDKAVAVIGDTVLPETLRKEALRRFISFQKQRDTYSGIRHTILEHDDISPAMKAYGINYLLQQKWQHGPHAHDFLWIARADVLPDSLRLHAVRKAVELYVRAHDYAALDEHIMRGKDLPPTARTYAEKYLRQYAVAEAERVMATR